MECTGIRCGGDLSRSLDRAVLAGIVDRRIRRSAKIPNRFRSVSASMAGAAATAGVPRRRNLELDLHGGGSGGGDRESRVSFNYERLDGWVRESVTEIVRNLKKAPLLVNVYSDGDRLETEEAVAEEWPAAKLRWEVGEAPAPDGVIFVEELRDAEESGRDEEDDDVTKAWGVVVQGRGSDCPPACYLLKTSSNRGLGLCCTHFCLVKVSSFRETTSSQLKNCWLMPGLQ